MAEPQKCSDCGSIVGHTYMCPRKFGFPRPAPKPVGGKKKKGAKTK